MSSLDEAAPLWRDSEVCGNLVRSWQVTEDGAEIAIAYSVNKEGTQIFLELFVNGDDVADRTITPIGQETSIGGMEAIVGTYVNEMLKEARK
jgi:hypothetical protein